MKKQILRLLILMVLAIFTVAISNAQITSTTAGGGWDSDTTWIGGIVPGASDNVIINGNVNVTYGAACLNININSGDTLRSAGYYCTLHVYGNITNNGVIQDNTYLHLHLYISGNIVNNGTWKNTYTRLEGTTAQNIYLEPGKIFSSYFCITNSSDTIYALTDLVLDGHFIMEGISFLELNNHIVEFIGPDYDFGGGTILSPSEFRGTLNMLGTTHIEGDLIITDTLQNKNSNNTAVFLNGNLTNNGIIKTNTSHDLDLYITGDLDSYGPVKGNSIYTYYTCNLYVSGDINAYESWDNTVTRLEGTTAQNIYLEPGKIFGSDFFITNSSDTIYALTDLVFDGYFRMAGNSFLELNNHIIEFIGTDHDFGGGTILSPSEFRGKVNMYSTTYIEGDLIVTDTLQNSNSYSVSVFLNGSLTNNGIIQNNTTGNLSLYINVDITNNGNWENYITRLNGTGQQHITLQAGKRFDGDFRIQNSTDTIIAATYLHFTKYFDLNDNILNLNNHNIRFTGTDTWFGDGTIVSPNEFLGTVNIYSATYIEGDLIVTDTLQNSNSYSVPVFLNGSLTNNGIIQNNTTGNLSLCINVDITNNGIWKHSSTFLDGYGQQLIFLQSGKTFESDFKITNTTDTIIATTDLHFTKYFNLNDKILNLNNHNIRFTGTDTWFGDGTIVSPNEFLGTVNIYSATYIEGDLIVTDTLQNSNSYSVPVFLNGSLTNNGIIQNNTTGNLSLYINVDITNNGIWKHSSTFLDGYGQQLIFLQSGKTFESDFKITNTTDTIIATTDLHFTKYFNLNDKILNLNNHNIRFTGTDTWFGDGTIVSPNEFQGTVNISTNTYIEGDLIVTDTLQNRNSNYPTVYLNGSLTNNGVIQNNTSNYLSLYISGDITNNGTWENSYTRLNGTTDQNIALMDDQFISGEVRFDANFGSSPYQWYYNAAILDSPDFNGETSAYLYWLVPVSPTWYGTFYCQTGAGNSRNIIVKESSFALQFDGTDEYVNCGHDASLNLTTTLTIEAWINPAGWGELADYGFGRIVDKYRFKLFLNDAGSEFYHEHSLVFGMHSGGSSFALNTPENSISLSSWQHIAATYDGSGNVHVYINGIEQTLTGVAPSGNIDDNSLDDLFIAENNNQNRAFEGTIDEVRIWNVVLNSSLIRENMYRTLLGNETGLVSYWQFNEDSGSTAFDFTGGNNGILHNMTDANRITSTAPIPYYTISNGDWESNNIWAAGQNVPCHAWARTRIKHNITINSTFEVIELKIDFSSTLTIITGYQLTVSGGE